MAEIWKDIPNFDGLYMASNLGKIKRLPRKIWNGKSFYLTKEAITYGRKTPKGYMSIELSKPNDEKRYLFQVHRLIALSFIDNPKNLPQINHINGVKDDNRLENLEWCDNSYNQIHAYSNGLRGRINKGKYIVAKDKNGNIINRFISIKAARDWLNIKSPRLSNILNSNKRVLYHGFYWEFENCEAARKVLAVNGLELPDEKKQLKLF